MLLGKGLLMVVQPILSMWALFAYRNPNWRQTPPFSPLNTTHIKTVSSLLVKKVCYLQNLTFSFPINIPQIETLFIWLPFPKKCERGRVVVFIPLQEGERALWVCTHAVSPEKKLILRNDPWALYG